MWPVDAGLRPEGRSGPLVRTARAATSRTTSAGPRRGSSRRCSRPARSPAIADLGHRYMETIAPMVWEAAGREGFVTDVQAMRRRVVDHIPAKEARPAAQARARWAARHRVRGPADAARARPLRPDAAVRRTRSRALEALTAGGYVGREDGGRWPTRTGSCAPSSTDSSSATCGVRTCCPTTPTRCARSAGRSA